MIRWRNYASDDLGKREKKRKEREEQECDRSRRLEHEPSQSFGIGETPFSGLVTDP
jgi:hypothetical protein